MECADVLKYKCLKYEPFFTGQYMQNLHDLYISQHSII